MRYFPLLLKMRIRVFGRLSGLNKNQIDAAIESIDTPQEFFEVCAMARAAGLSIPTEFTEVVKEGKITDWIKNVVAWLQSEEGKQFLKFLFSLLGFLV